MYKAPLFIKLNLSAGISVFLIAMNFRNLQFTSDAGLSFYLEKYLSPTI